MKSQCTLARVANCIVTAGPPDAAAGKVGVMPANTMKQWTEPVVKEPTEPRAGRLVVVVGFDGSESAFRALDAATQLISGRPGGLVVVYVAHLSAAAGFSPEALVESRKGFDAIEEQFNDAIRNRLEGVEPRWSLERRDGIVAPELIAVANDASRDNGEDASVVIVVGSAMHTYHHVVGSVPVALVRHAKYPIVVVP
jgi:nucleotide-binding universal stress UspA family protein